MAARRTLLLFMTAARGFAAQASSVPPATAGKALIPAATSCKALVKPTVTPDVAAFSSFDARRRSFLCYGALAAVAGAAGIMYFASGVESPLVPDGIDDIDSQKSEKSMALRYGALAAMAGAGIFFPFFGSRMKAPVVMDALAATGTRARGARGPSRQEVRRLTAVLEKVYRRLPEKERSIKTDKDQLNWFITWFNRFKEVLMLPSTFKEVYAVVVSMWFPYIKSSMDGSTYCTCPFSGLVTLVATCAPKEEDADGNDENVPLQNLERVEAKVENVDGAVNMKLHGQGVILSLHNVILRDAKAKMVTFRRTKSLQQYRIFANGSCKSFLHFASKLSRGISLFLPADVTMDLVAQQRC